MGLSFIKVSPGRDFAIRLVKQLRARMITPEVFDLSLVVDLVATRIDLLFPSGSDFEDYFGCSSRRLEEEIMQAAPSINWGGFGPFTIWGYSLFDPTSDDHFHKDEPQ